MILTVGFLCAFSSNSYAQEQKAIIFGCINDTSWSMDITVGLTTFTVTYNKTTTGRHSPVISNVLYMIPFSFIHHIDPVHLFPNPIVVGPQWDGMNNLTQFKVEFWWYNNSGLYTFYSIMFAGVHCPPIGGPLDPPIIR